MSLVFVDAGKILTACFLAWQAEQMQEGFKQISQAIEQLAAGNSNSHMRPTTGKRPASAVTVAAQGAACWPTFIEPPKSALATIKYQIEIQDKAISALPQPAWGLS